MTGHYYEVKQTLLIILPLDTFSLNADNPTKMEPDPHQAHLQHFQLLHKERQRKKKEQRNRVHQQHVQQRQEQLRHQQRYHLRLQQQQQQVVPQQQQQPQQAVPQLPILEQLQPQPYATPPNEVEEEEKVLHPKPTKTVKQAIRAEDNVVLDSTQTPDKVGQFEANASSRKICYTTTPAAEGDVADRLSLMIVAQASSTAPNLDSRAASTSAAASGISQTVQPTSVSEVVAKSSSSSSEDTFVSISSPTTTPVPSPEQSTSSSTSTSDFAGFPDIELPPDSTPTKSFPPVTPKGPNRREAIKNKKAKLRQGFGALATTVIRGKPSTAAAAAAAQPQVLQRQKVTPQSQYHHHFRQGRSHTPAVFQIHAPYAQTLVFLPACLLKNDKNSSILLIAPGGQPTLRPFNLRHLLQGPTLDREACPKASGVLIQTFSSQTTNRYG